MGAKTAGLQAAPIPFISEKRGLIVLGRFDGVLLVSDFDDTLYDPQLRIPPRNLQALDCFLRGGGRFTVATGRAHTTFAPYAGLAPINAPVILSNGSALYDFQAGRMLYQTFLSPQAPDDLGALTQALPELGFEAYHGEDIYVFRPNWVTWMHMKKVGSHCTVCAIEEMPTPWTKVIVQQEHDQLLRARAWLEEHCPGRYEAIFSNPYYLEVTEKGSTKGGMVLRLAGMLGVDREHIYCVGDNQNDIPMLAQSAIPFAPANCAPEVKQWGARILCPCDQGVIGDILPILEERYPE